MGPTFTGIGAEFRVGDVWTCFTKKKKDTPPATEKSVSLLSVSFSSRAYLHINLYIILLIHKVDVRTLPTTLPDTSCEYLTGVQASIRSIVLAKHASVQDAWKPGRAGKHLI